MISSNIFDNFTKPIEKMGEMLIFFKAALVEMFKPPFRFEEVVKHMEFVGNRSVSIIILTGLFSGLALSFQIWIGFSLFGATSFSGPTVALGIFRELGPVLTGLLVAARAGGAMAAQLGTMRVTEQIDAMKVMGVRPIQFLVSPRILASFVCVPFLCALFDFVAMLGSHLLCINVLGVDEAIFWDKIKLYIRVSDVYEGLFKACIFGICFSTICTYMGYYTSGGAKGVGESTNRGVVYSMVSIIVLDYITTNFIRFFMALG